MKRSNFSVAMANLIMETISELQKTGQKASVRDIKETILLKYGMRSEKYLKLVPQYIHRGVTLGLIGRYGNNYRTRMYVAKRRRRAARRRRRKH